MTHYTAVTWTYTSGDSASLNLLVSYPGALINLRFLVLDEAFVLIY